MRSKIAQQVGWTTSVAPFTPAPSSHGFRTKAIATPSPPPFRGETPFSDIDREDGSRAPSTLGGSRAMYRPDSQAGSEVATTAPHSARTSIFGKPVKPRNSPKPDDGSKDRGSPKSPRSPNSRGASVAGWQSEGKEANGDGGDPETMSVWDGVVKQSLGYLRHDISLCKRDIAELMEELRDMKTREEARAKFDEETAKKLKENHENLVDSRKSWKERAQQLSCETASLQVQTSQALQKGLDSLNSQMQEQLQNLEGLMSKLGADSMKRDDLLEAAIEGKHQETRATLADFQKQEHIHELQHLKMQTDSFSALQQRVELEMSSISKELNDKRKMHITYYEDALNELGTSLRKEAAELAAMFGPKLESYGILLETSLDEFKETLQAEFQAQCEDRARVHSSFVNSVEGTVDNLKETMAALETRFAHEVQRMSDSRRQDNLDLQRAMHNCVNLMLPSKSVQRQVMEYSPSRET